MDGWMDLGIIHTSRLYVIIFRVCGFFGVPKSLPPSEKNIWKINREETLLSLLHSTTPILSSVGKHHCSAHHFLISIIIIMHNLMIMISLLLVCTIITIDNFVISNDECMWRHERSFEQQRIWNQLLIMYLFPWQWLNISVVA